jgi:hypothetical protein
VEIEKLLAQMESAGTPSAAAPERAAPERTVGERSAGGSSAATAREAARQAPSAPGPSPFERDQMRKRSYEASTQAAAATMERSDTEIRADDSSGDEPGAPPSAVSVHTVEHSREESWAHEILRRLEQRGKEFLVSVVEGGQWAFGEEEVRLHPANQGIAKILPETDLRTLGEVASEVVGRTVRLTLTDKMPANGGASATSRGAAKAPPQRATENVPAAGAAEEKVRQDPEVREYEQVFGKAVSGVRALKK